MYWGWLWSFSSFLRSVAAKSRREDSFAEMFSEELPPDLVDDVMMGQDLSKNILQHLRPDVHADAVALNLGDGQQVFH